MDETKRPDLDEIEARVKAAPSGPWRAELDVFDSDNEGIVATVDNLHHASTSDGVLFTAATDQKPSEGGWARARASRELAAAEFIAHAREDVPALVAYARALESTVATQRATLERQGSEHWATEERIASAEAAVLDREARLSDLQARYDSNRRTMLVLANACRCPVGTTARDAADATLLAAMEELECENEALTARVAELERERDEARMREAQVRAVVETGAIDAFTKGAEAMRERAAKACEAFAGTMLAAGSERFAAAAFRAADVIRALPLKEDA